MLSKKKKHINKQVIIYRGQSANGLTVEVIRNILANYEHSKFLIKTETTDRRGMTKTKIVAKSNDIRKVSELLSNLIGRKISLSEESGLPIT